MNVLPRLLFASASLVALAACGSPLDLGSDALPGCEGTSGAPVVLATFADHPGFYPSAVAIVADAAYVGGLELPPGGFADNPDVSGIGRLFRVPLAGGAAVEVWRGDAFRPPLRVQDARIYFSEVDVTNRSSQRVFAGVDVYDTATSRASRVENLPGRDFVTDLVVGAEGLVFGAGSFAPRSSFSIARHADGVTRSIFEHPERSASFFLREGHVLAQMMATEDEDGLSGEGEARDLGVFAVGPAGLTLERRFEGLLTSMKVGASYTLIDTDAAGYYVASRYAGDERVSTYRHPRRPGQDRTTGDLVVSSSTGAPLFFGGAAYFTPSVDRSMIRTRLVSRPLAEGDREVVFDPRRQVIAFTLDACKVAWISESYTERDRVRLMVGPRK